jgi:hypothetical protein
MQVDAAAMQLYAPENFPLSHERRGGCPQRKVA